MSLHTTPAELSALLHRLYFGVTDATRTGDFLARCCKHIGAHCGAVALCELATQKWRYVDFYPGRPDASQHYQEKYAVHDPVVPALLKRPPRRFYARRELVSDAEIRSNPYFTEWHAGLGLGELCAARFPMGGEYSVHVAFLRNTGVEPFNCRELEFLDLLLPHMEQAMLLHNHLDRLHVLADLAQEHLAQTGAGIAILNEDGRVHVLNRTAERIVCERSGITLEAGAIGLADPMLNERFQHLVKTCISLSRRPGTMPGGALSVPRPQRAPLGLMVLPYRSQQGLKTVLAQGSRAVVLIYDPDMPRLEPPAILRDLYGLTEAEVQVCWRLANGENLEDISTALGLARETVRSQLKRIFAKTGTSRQPELVRLVLLGPALWAHMPEGFRDLLPDLSP